MAQKDFDCASMPRIKQRVAPKQPVLANSEDTPSDQTPPFTNRNNEGAAVRTVHVAPSQVSSIATHKKSICRRDSLEQAIEFLARLRHELELIAADPAARASDAFQRKLATPVGHGLDSIAAQETQRESLNIRDIEAIIIRDFMFTECCIKM